MNFWHRHHCHPRSALRPEQQPAEPLSKPARAHRASIEISLPVPADAVPPSPERTAIFPRLLPVWLWLSVQSQVPPRPPSPQRSRNLENRVHPQSWRPVPWHWPHPVFPGLWPVPSSPDPIDSLRLRAEPLCPGPIISPPPVRQPSVPGPAVPPVPSSVVPDLWLLRRFRYEFLSPLRPVFATPRSLAEPPSSPWL